uniref:SPRY domain-containing protein n=1 Tax=Meloidogyne javanica TaxID=6303 RepID=A0A915LJM7_MELJA
MSKLLQTAKEQILQSIEVLEEMVKERDEKLNLKDEQIKLKDERIAKFEKHVLLSSQAKFVLNENSFIKAEFSRQHFYYAGQPFKRIVGNFFGIQYLEVTLDISKFKAIGFIKYAFIDIQMFKANENEVKIKYTKNAEEKEFNYPFTPSNLLTAGCAMVTSPTNDLFDKPRTFVFFTVNGHFIGNAISLDEDEELVPTFTLSEEYADVKTNFGEKAFLFKLDTNFIETLLKF